MRMRIPLEPFKVLKNQVYNCFQTSLQTFLYKAFTAIVSMINMVLETSLQTQNGIVLTDTQAQLRHRIGPVS